MFQHQMDEGSSMIVFFPSPWMKETVVREYTDEWTILTVK